MTGGARAPRTRPGHRRPASFDEADEGLLAVLAEQEGARNYAAWVTTLIAPHVHGRILELGAGRGTYSEQLAAMGSLTAMEPSVAHSRVLRERLEHVDGAQVVTALLDQSTPGTYDTIVALNVLEHIADDAAALADAWRVLAPGGALVLWVPAFEVLYGDFDQRIGHHRRYRRRGLRRLVEHAGFRVEVVHYANLPGFFAWLLVVRLLHRTPTTSTLTRVYDRWVVPVTRRVEAVVKPPLGQSVLLVARRD